MTNYGFMFIISVFAAICSTSASIPQLLGNVSKLSTATMFLRGVGALLWVIYGFMRIEYALVVSSAISLIIECFLFLKTYMFMRSAKDDSVSSQDCVPPKISEPSDL